MADSREKFGSRIGFILAAVGSAVGIGNLVGFPVNAAKNGGGAFLFIYIFFVVFICLPVMIAELSLGRFARRDPLGAYRKLGNGSKSWLAAGWLSVIAPFFVGVFYTVITVWIFGYLINSAIGNLDKLASTDAFEEFTNSYSLFAYMAGVGLVVYVILASGVKDGIERAAKIMMPALFVFLIGLMIYVLTLENAWTGALYFFTPDLTKIDAAVVSNALSQGFFSLSIGFGTLLTYGSYLSKQTDIPASAGTVALLDTGVAFVAGLVILPAVFSFNPDINPQELSESSFSLIFSLLPKIFFAQEGTIGYVGASVVATSFFLLMFFAAITSLVSIIEVPIASLKEQLGHSRRKALNIVGPMMAILIVPCAASFGMAAFVTEFVTYGGGSKSFFDLVVDVFYDTILPLNGFLLCLFVVYRWKSANFNKELEQGNVSYKGTMLERYVNFSIGTFIPAILLLVFLNTVVLKITGQGLIG